MDLRTRYTILSFGEPLLYFFKHAEINVYQNTKFNLLDFLPILKRGNAIMSEMKRDESLKIITTNNSNLRRLLSRYGTTKTTNETSILPDDLMEKAFNGTISSLYYDTNTKMADAIKTGYIQHALNVFEVMAIHDNSFNPKYLREKDIAVIINLNSHKLYLYEDDESFIEDPDFLSDIIHENQCMNDIDSILWYLPNTNRQIKLFDFIQQSLCISATSITSSLIDDPWIHLLYAIILNNVDLVNENLKFSNPEKYNNEIYQVALRVKNAQIITLISNAIGNKILLKHEVFNIQFAALCGPSDLPQTILNYMKNF